MKNKFAKNSVFVSGSPHGNVVLNFMGSPASEFGHYAGAFHDAGKLLVNQIAQSQGYSDLQVCPIVFLYRHALELYLKQIINIGNNILRLSGKEPILEKKDHKLSQLVPAIKGIFDAVEWEWKLDIDGMANDKDFQKFLEDFERIDPMSFAFRYPTTKKGEATLPEHFVFDVIKFSKKLDPIFDLFDGAVTGLEELWQSGAEAVHEAQGRHG